MAEYIEKQAAIDALWKALHEYEDKTEKQFQESEDLDVGDWIGHRIFVQNMNDIDRQTILNLPSAQPEQHWIPCSKRLPKKDDRYQVTRYDYVTNTEFIDILWYEKNTWWDRQATGDYAVTAWMPLSEPYKAESEDKE